jgi:ribosomal protein S27AE
MVFNNGRDVSWYKELKMTTKIQCSKCEKDAVIIEHKRDYCGSCAVKQVIKKVHKRFVMRTIRDYVLVTQTRKAIRIKLENGYCIWLPKSVIHSAE